MLKWLLVLGVIWVIYQFFIKSKPLKNFQTDNKKESDAQDMIECARCGVYVELDEAILSNGRYYCSKECVEG